MNRVFGTFYKYRSFGAPGSEQRERVTRMLRAREIYFAPPSSLNDPFDCRPRFTFPGPPAERRRILRDMWIEGAVRAGVPHKIARKDSEKVATKLMLTVNSPKLRAKQFFKFVDDKTAVFCMSESWDVASQWAYYADIHTGFCLELTVTEAIAFAPAYRINYAQQRPTVDLFKILTPAAPTEALTDSLMEAVTTKATSWSSELEVRALQNKLGVYVLPEGMLNGIIFGMNSTDEDVEWMIETATAEGLTLDYSRVVPDVDEYRFVREPIDPN